jgi:CRISPR-associated endoribonuclease Cas6
MNDGARYAIPEIPYLRLRCTLRAEEEALLPSFKGSMLRGAFGRALRKSVCVMGPEQPCETCGLRAACLYTRLFETFIESEPPPFLRGQTAAPRPFVFEAEDERRRFAPGDRLRFDLLLFGSAVGLQTLAAVAVARMAGRGLGERRRRFAVEEIAFEDAAGGFRPLLSADRPRPEELAPPLLPPRDGLPEGSITLRFRTPVRLKAGGQLLRGLGFRGLVFRMLARVLELAHFFGDRAAIDWQIQSFLRQAEGVRVVEQSFAWKDVKRYSARQGTEMSLGGFVGSMRLAGDLAPFAPLLRTAEIVHVGKGTTFGLGRVEIEAADRNEE